VHQRSRRAAREVVDAGQRANKAAHWPSVWHQVEPLRLQVRADW
jgi:hypothetical protein